MEMVSNQTYDLDILTWLGATELDAATINLFQNDVSPTRESVIGDFTAATYTGNGAETIVWHDPSLSETNEVEVVSDEIVFRATGSGVINTIFGAFIQSSAGGTPYLMAVRFDGDGIPMTSALSEIRLVVRVRRNEVLIEIV